MNAQIAQCKEEDALSKQREFNRMIKEQGLNYIWNERNIQYKGLGSLASSVV